MGADADVNAGEISSKEKQGGGSYLLLGSALLQPFLSRELGS